MTTFLTFTTALNVAMTLVMLLCREWSTAGFTSAGAALGFFALAF